MLLAMVLTMAGVLWHLESEFNRSWAVSFSFLSASLVILLGAPIAALILGFLQTVVEVRRDQWAFLMHRGVSPSRIFLAKVAAGLGVYAVVTIVPALLALVWIPRGGIARYPFSWYQTVPMLAAIPGAIAFYFAAMLGVVWKGPWHFSRLLPLVAPSFLFIGLAGIVADVTDYVPVSVFILTAIVVIVLGVATWGVFVRSGEATGRPRIASVCLALPVFVAMFGACFGLFSGGVGLVYDWLLPDVVGHRAWLTRPHTQYSVNREGHVVRIVHSAATDSRGSKRPVVSIDDLDDPGSKRYAAVVGKTLWTRDDVAGTPEWDPLPMAGGWIEPTGIIRLLSGVRGRTRILEPLRLWATPHTTVPRGGGLYWICSSADGWIYGYSQEQVPYKFGRQRWTRPKLMHVVGPDGFTGPAERPRRRFGRLLADPSGIWRGGRPPWEVRGWEPSDHINGAYLLFDNGLFKIDLGQHAVKEVLAAREGKRIRALATMEADNAIGVIYDDMIDIHSIVLDAGLELPGERVDSFPIPAELASFDRFEFGRVPGRDLIVFQTGHGLRAPDLRRFVEMQRDGTVVRTRDFLDPDRFPLEQWPAIWGAAGFAPPVGLLIVGPGVGSGLLAWLWRQWPLGMVIAAAILLAVTAGCAGSAWRTSRRYGFDRPARIAWLCASILLGPAGLLTMWFLRDWPASETCPGCERRRPVNCVQCPHCGRTAPSPPVNGTEILASGTRPSTAQAC